jgi:hypothetical protein
MSISALKEYIKMLIEGLNEGRMREADISDDRKVPWGSDEHVSDLERRLRDAEYWRGKYGTGTEKRSHYRNVVRHLKNELKSARKANQSKINEKDKK